MSTTPSLFQRLDKVRQALVRWFFDSPLAPSLIAATAMLIIVIGFSWPVVLWAVGGVWVLAAGLRIHAACRAMSITPNLFQNLDRVQEAFVRWLFDSRFALALIIPPGMLIVLIGLGRPVVLWAGVGVGALAAGLRILAAWRAWKRERGDRKKGRVDRPSVYTQLALSDGQATHLTPVRFSRAKLRELLESSPRSDGAVALYVPAYGKMFQLMVDPDEEPNPPSAGTVRTVNDVLRWSDVQRAQIRELLVADALAAGAAATLDTVEVIVSGGGLSIGEGHGEKSRLATLNVHAPWGHEGSLEIVIRDGEPIAVGGRYLELDVYDAAYD